MPRKNPFDSGDEVTADLGALTDRPFNEPVFVVKEGAEAGTYEVCGQCTVMGVAPGEVIREPISAEQLAFFIAAGHVRKVGSGE